MKDLSIVQKTRDLIKWYVPILNQMPRSHRFSLGERLISSLYDLLEGFIEARYSKEKLTILEKLNTKLDILRHQTQLLFEFDLLSSKRYEFVSKQFDAIGSELGGWLKQQKQRRIPA